MSQFSAAIKSFLAGELDFAGLDRTLQELLQSGQASSAELAQLLDQVYRAGRLPTQLYVILKSRLDTPAAAAPPGVPASAQDPFADRTVIMTPPPATPATPSAPDSDRTILGTDTPVLDGVTNGAGGVPGTAAADDATRVSDTTPGIVTSPTGPVTTGRTSPTTGRTSTTGGTDSSWSDLEAQPGTAEKEIRPGVMLKGRFVLEEIIGRGGMGEVYKARDLRKEEAQDRNPWLAVKILNDSFKSHPESLKALQRESRKAQKLAHPNIVNVYDFDRDGATVFMTMEYLEGEPLDHVTKQYRGRGMPEHEALKIIRDMGHALAHAHSHGIVHSDFKPGNAYLTNEGVTKVFDFGIARASSHASQAQGEATLFDAGELGAMTPAYASYEMLEGMEPDERDDIYALACVAYELLAGRHPFNKIPANQAQQQGLVPERIKSLSRGQWKALARGLAFSRDRRSASVTEFLSGLERKRLQRGVLIAAAAAVLLVVVLLANWVPDYLHERRLVSIVRELKSGDSAAMSAALEAVRALDADDRAGVLLDSRVELIDWFRKRQDELVNDIQGRYDYPAAQREIETALEFFPDSAQVHELRARLENSRDQLLNDLNRRFISHLQDGRLLASEQDDMEDVLRILAQVQPDHALLHDARLSAGYAERATQLLETGELEQSMNVLLAGLQRFAQDPSLVNLRDRVAAEQARVEREQRIAALTEQLSGALATLDGFEAVDRIRPELQELKRLAPDAAVAKQIGDVTAGLVDGELAVAIDARRWEAGSGLLRNYVDVLDSGFMKSRQEKLDKARDTYLAKMDALYADLIDAVGSRRLGGKARDSAQTLLGKLESEGADTALLERARSAIGQGYLELAREARAGGNWDTARGHVQEGLGQQPGATLVASLQAESEEITHAEALEQQQLAEAELQARAAERQQRIDTLYADFTHSLEASPYRPDTARQSIAVLDRLAAISPSDPLLGKGREQVAGHLLASIRSLSEARQWDDALAMARQSVEVVPGSETLSSALVEIERGRSQQLARQQEQNVEHYRQSLAASLAQPVLDENWTSSVQDDLRMLDDLLSENQRPWLAEQRAAVAALYLDRAREMRGNERFSEARSLLDAARRFVTEDAAYQAERQALAGAEAKFAETNKEKLRLARIEGDKQSFLTQAKARDVTNARQTLAGLRKELPGTDPFLVTTAPEALGDAYLRLAESAAKKGKYSSALKLVDAGLEEAPAMTALLDAKTRIDRERRVGEVRWMMQKADALGTAQVRKALDGLKADPDLDYAGLEKEFADIVAQRITTLGRQDYPAAEALLADARKLFPDVASIGSLRLEKPVAKPPATATAVPAPAKPAEKPAGKPATAVSRATSAGVECLPTLAGYGRRARGTCYDMLPGDSKGPLLIVVPAGGGISEPFAISKYEISIGDYNTYCKASGKCSGVRGGPELPVTGVSLQQARAYADWMSSNTGYTYRIPTDAEWSYAANAQGKQPAKDFNCRVMLGDQLIKGQSLSSVNVGKPNGWGLINYVGNAQEWVTTGTGTAVRGGAYQDTLSACELTLTRAHNGQADELTGFRLVRTLRLGG